MSTSHLQDIMTPQEYIQGKLDTLAEPIVYQTIDDTHLRNAILNKLLGKHFRKYKADDTLLEKAHRAIEIAIETKAPIQIGILFGGNKLWRFDEAPEIDWAELLSLMYYVEWAKTIASVYKPGVLLDYYSQDISVETLNNVPHEETDRYTSTFRGLLKFMKPYIPSEIMVRYRRHADEYNDRSEYLAELGDAKKAILTANNSQLPELTEEQKAATELNVRLRPDQDDDSQWREKVELEHQAIFRTKSLLPYLTNSANIPICPTPFPGCLALGSTRRSIAKFWAGVGALQQKDSKYIDLVLTPKQLQSASFDWANMNLPGLIGKNFSKIRVLKKREP